MAVSPITSNPILPTSPSTTVAATNNSNTNEYANLPHTHDTDIHKVCAVPGVGLVVGLGVMAVCTAALITSVALMAIHSLAGIIKIQSSRRLQNRIVTAQQALQQAQKALQADQDLIALEVAQAQAAAAQQQTISFRNVATVTLTAQNNVHNQPVVNAPPPIPPTPVPVPAPVPDPTDYAQLREDQASLLQQLANLEKEEERLRNEFNQLRKLQTDQHNDVLRYFELHDLAFAAMLEALKAGEGKKIIEFLPNGPEKVVYISALNSLIDQERMEFLQKADEHLLRIKNRNKFKNKIEFIRIPKDQDQDLSELFVAIKATARRISKSQALTRKQKIKIVSEKVDKSKHVEFHRKLTKRINQYYDELLGQITSIDNASFQQEDSLPKEDNEVTNNEQVGESFDLSSINLEKRKLYQSLLDAGIPITDLAIENERYERIPDEDKKYIELERLISEANEKRERLQTRLDSLEQMLLKENQTQVVQPIIVQPPLPTQNVNVIPVATNTTPIVTPQTAVVVNPPPPRAVAPHLVNAVTAAQQALNNLNSRLNTPTRSAVRAPHFVAKDQAKHYLKYFVMGFCWATFVGAIVLMVRQQLKANSTTPSI